MELNKKYKTKPLIDKLGGLKYWLRSVEDAETKYYIKLAISQINKEIRKIQEQF